MPTLAEIMGGIDSYVTPAKRRLVDLLRNPADYTAQAFGQVGDNVAAFNKNAVTAQEGQQLGLLGSVMGGAPQYQQAQSKVLQGLMGIAPIGATVWHGSPHKFDKFDASKIGTGEGAQAYGHGIYTASSPEVAKSYQVGLSPGGKEVLIDGAAPKFDMSGPGGLPGTPQGKISNLAIMALQRHKDLDKAISSESDAAVKGVLEQMRGRVSYNDPGNLYKVDLPDEHIAKMLDWDKPLSQQGDILNTIRGLIPKDNLAAFDANVKNGISGVNAYKNYIPVQTYAVRDPGASTYKASQAKSFEEALAEVGGDRGRIRIINDNDPAKVTEKLRQAGIPGIRYLDGGSRGAGQGTSNYVVFPGNEGLLNILERNGKPIK